MTCPRLPDADGAVSSGSRDLVDMPRGWDAADVGLRGPNGPNKLHGPVDYQVDVVAHGHDMVLLLVAVRDGPMYGLRMNGYVARTLAESLERAARLVGGMK